MMTFETIIYILAAVLGAIAFFLVFFKARWGLLRILSTKNLFLHSTPEVLKF